MKINRVFNNNVVSVIDDTGIEKVVTGRGIAFKKRPGDEVDSKLIEKTFVIHDKDELHKFEELIEDIPLEHMIVGEEIITYAKQTLGKRLNDLIYIGLIDHIYAATERFKEGIHLKNPLLWDIKRFYPDEYKIGLKGLELVKEKFNIELPVDEAGFIAFHIVNASYDKSSISDVIETSKIMQEIINIVKYEFRKDFNEESVYFYRFTTHLKFFAKRVVDNATFKEGVEDELFVLVRNKYKNSYRCVEKIADFLKSEYGYEISDEEKLYLTIHIERVIYKNDI